MRLRSWGAALLPDVLKIFVRAGDEHGGDGLTEKAVIRVVGVYRHDHGTAPVVQHFTCRVGGTPHGNILNVIGGNVLGHYAVAEGAPRDAAEIVDEGPQGAAVEKAVHVDKVGLHVHVAFCPTGACVVDDDVQEVDERVRVVELTQTRQDRFLFLGEGSFLLLAIKWSHYTIPSEQRREKAAGV